MNGTIVHGVWKGLTLLLKKNRSMKTYFEITTGHRALINLVLGLCIAFSALPTVSGQEKRIFHHDYLLPAKGKSMVEFYSGIPYVALGQYGYGISNKVSLGIIYGYTPFEKGYGLRLKAVIAQPSASFRLNVKSPFIYYPGMKKDDGEPWVLAWPTLNGDLKLKNGARVWAGVGLIGAACVDYLFESGGHEGEGEHDPNGTDPMPPKGEEDMFSLFNTFQFGYSKPLSDKWSFVAEVAPVMEGFKLKSPNGFLDTAPIIVTLGLSCSF